MADVVSDDEWKTGVLGHFPGLGDISNFTIVSLQDSNVNCLAMVLGYNYWLHPPYDIEETTEYRMLSRCRTAKWMAGSSS